jgi:hypothetical protein
VRRDHTQDYVLRLPDARPPGLRLVTRTHAWYRLDAQRPGDWRWRPFREPQHRFDPASGRLRVRYAADSLRAAMRERFDAEGRVVSRAHLDLRVIELTGRVSVLDLRQERTLDALGLDDQVSTSRAPGVWAACQALTDLCDGWFGERLGGLVYRSRTTPQRSANLAFLQRAALGARDLGPLRRQEALLAACVSGEGFLVEGW